MAQVVHKVSPAVVRERIHASPEEIAAFCRAHHIRWLALFGSVLRDDFRDDSDVDVLVEFIPEYPITFFDLHEMEETVSRLFGGRRIDLVTLGSLHRLIRGRVLPLAEVQYAEG
jgi:predicted nucleotidyltransferase